MTEQDSDRTVDTAGSSAGARQRAIEAYETARERTSETLGEAPLLALAGGLAAGALIAALLPQTDSETRMVKPTARRVRQTAKVAYEAARATRTAELAAAGISRDKGEETIRNLLDGVVGAARASADAALDAARNKA